MAANRYQFVLPKSYLVVNYQYIARDQLITKAKMPSYWRICHSLKVFLSRVMHGPDNPGTGYEEGQYTLLFSTIAPHITTKLLIFVFLFDLNNKLNDPIVRTEIIHLIYNAIERGLPIKLFKGM